MISFKEFWEKGKVVFPKVVNVKRVLINPVRPWLVLS